ncbi:unnamed protein product, partial [Amoebophrya sp. A120]|eukprot:GSA120T00009202001.1
MKADSSLTDADVVASPTTRGLGAPELGPGRPAAPAEELPEHDFSAHGSALPNHSPHLRDNNSAPGSPDREHPDVLAAGSTLSDQVNEIIVEQKTEQEDPLHGDALPPAANLDADYQHHQSFGTVMVDVKNHVAGEQDHNPWAAPSVAGPMPPPANALYQTQTGMELQPVFYPNNCSFYDDPQQAEVFSNYGYSPQQHEFFQEPYLYYDGNNAGQQHPAVVMTNHMPDGAHASASSCSWSHEVQNSWGQRDMHMQNY